MRPVLKYSLFNNKRRKEGRSLLVVLTIICSLNSFRSCNSEECSKLGVLWDVPSERAVRLLLGPLVL